MVSIIKGIRKQCVIILTCFASLVFGLFFGAISSEAASNRAIGFYRTDFYSGIAITGPARFSSILGYSSATYKNSSVSNWKSKTQNSKVEFIHSHGDYGKFSLASGVWITGKNIQNMSFTNKPKLVYISACDTGNGSAENGNVGQALVNKGVKAVVAFKGKIVATTSTNGIHRFNLKVAHKLTYNHYNLSVSLILAKGEIYQEDNRYWGTDHLIV